MDAFPDLGDEPIPDPHEPIAENEEMFVQPPARVKRQASVSQRRHLDSVREKAAAARRKQAAEKRAQKQAPQAQPSPPQPAKPIQAPQAPLPTRFDYDQFLTFQERFETEKQARARQKAEQDSAFEAEVQRRLQERLPKQQQQHAATPPQPPQKPEFGAYANLFM